MPEWVVCNLCGHDEALPLFETHDHLLPLPGTYRYVRCRNCGLVYINPQPTWAERAPHYASAYRGYHFLGSEPSLLQRLGMTFGLHKRYQILAKYLQGGRLLDIGCGGGDFLATVQRRSGWRVYGLEAVPLMAATALQRYELEIAQGDLNHLSFASSCFDAVTLWTVLEHLSNPLQGLRECVRILRPGGILVIRTVTVDSWSARFFGPNWVGYDAPRVLFAFSRRTLRKMLAGVGLNVLEMRSYFHDFHPFLWSLQNLCETKFKAASWCRLMNNLVRSWPVRISSYPFFALQTYWGGNSFVTAVAQKR